MIFSNLDSWKSGLQQVKDNSKQIFNQNVNAAKTFEHNSREINAAAERYYLKQQYTKLQSQTIQQHHNNNKATKKSNQSIFPLYDGK